MLQITIPAKELWDNVNLEFINVKKHTLQLEHSLVSISKWESKWCKPFFSHQEKSYEETIDYIKCMTLTQNVQPEAYRCLTQQNVKEITDYIEAPMTATTFSDNSTKKSRNETITSELIYYWMTALNIPMECQKWHINRLFTLIRVCEIKNQPEKKVNTAERINQYAKLNAERRAKMNSKG
jgi:hypothetical protein